MTAYIIRRIIQSFCVLLISTFMIFCVVRLLPGDPILLYLSQDEYETNLSQEEIDALRHEYGLTGQYLYNIWTGGGRSFMVILECPSFTVLQYGLN